MQIKSKAAKDLAKGDVVLTGYGKPCYEVLERAEKNEQIELTVLWADGGIGHRVLDHPNLQIPVK